MNSKGKVIFIDSVHSILEKRLEKMGFECDIKTDLSREQIEKIMGSYKGVVIRSKFLFDKQMIDKAEKLEFIARSGSGMENIDVAYAHSKNIKCYNSPEGNRNAVAEHCLAMLLSLFRNLNRADEEVRNSIWKREENRGIELDGKTIGLIGFGNTGKSFAKKLRGFDVEILAHDKYLNNYGNDYVKEATLEEIQEKADIISLHVPLTLETTHFFSSDFFAKCSKAIYLINTSRGKCLKTDDMVKALKSGKVLGACLDVLEYESISFENIAGEMPEAFEYLRKSQKVILSPHIAGWTQESYFKLSSVLADKIEKDFG